MKWQAMMICLVMFSSDQMAMKRAGLKPQIKKQGNPTAEITLFITKNLSIDLNIHPVCLRLWYADNLLDFFFPFDHRAVLVTLVNCLNNAVGLAPA
jgi:hypothetical protein